MACELWENIKRQPNLTLLCPASPQRIEFREDAALLGLTDGKSVSAKLVVAADGRDSWVRRSAGLDVFDTHYNERAWWRISPAKCRIAAAPSNGSATMACWPICHCPGSASRSSGRPLMRSPTNSWRCRPRTLRPCCRRWWQALGKLELLTPPAAFPLRLMRVPKVVAPRLALVGTPHTASTRCPPWHQPRLPGRPRTGGNAGSLPALARHRQPAHPRTLPARTQGGSHPAADIDRCAAPPVQVRPARHAAVAQSRNEPHEPFAAHKEHADPLCFGYAVIESPLWRV